MYNPIKLFILVGIVAAVTFAISCGHNHSEGDGHNHGESHTTHSEGDGHDHGESNTAHSEGDGHNHGESHATHSDDDGHNHEAEGHEHHEEGLHLTSEQAQTVGLEFGSFTAIKVNDFVKATGTLGLPPNAYYSVSPKTNGIINVTKKIVDGDFVRKGEVIAYLENPDFIEKQQQYLEAKAQLKLKKLDVERQKTLVEANAGVSKNLQNAETEVVVLEAKATGLSKQLNYLGIPTSTLSPNSIRHRIAIVAPVSGYISGINFHNGMFVQSSTSLMDVLSAENLHVELNVFEKDIAQINVGQKLSYSIPALGNSLYNAEVSVIGKEFDADSKTIRIYGQLAGTKPRFLKGVFVNAKIWLSDKSVDALPEEAIIQDGENAYIYVSQNLPDAQEIEFIPIRVIKGATNNGFTAIKIIDEIPDGMQIVIKGAYYVYAQSKAGELEHEH